MDAKQVLSDLLENDGNSAQAIADSMLNHAVSLDEGRPADDCSVVVLKVIPHTGDLVRRMNVRLPITLGQI